MYCANKEENKNKICKGKKTINDKTCVVTNKEDFKRKINQNVGYYPFLDNYTIRLKRGWHSFGVRGITDPEANMYEMPDFVRYWRPKRIEGDFQWIEGDSNMFVPWTIIQWTRSYFRYYAGKDRDHTTLYSTPTTGWNDDLYLELKMSTIDMEENESRSKKIRDQTWKLENSGKGVFNQNIQRIKFYAKLDRGASWNFSNDSLDNFCYYNKKAKDCFSRAWALECETADKIIEQNCRQYTNENACRKETKCERWEE